MQRPKAILYLAYCFTAVISSRIFQVLEPKNYSVKTKFYKTAYSTDTVFIHSFPIAKVLHITSLRIFLLTISQ